MHLSQFDTKVKSNAGVEYMVRDPQGAIILNASGEPGLIFTLLGQDSEAYQKIQRLQNKETMQDVLKKRNTSMSPERIEQNAIEVLVACTTGWGSFSLEAEGGDFEFNEKNVRKIYTDFPWIKTQAWDFIHDRGEFLGE